MSLEPVNADRHLLVLSLTCFAGCLLALYALVWGW